MHYLLSIHPKKGGVVRRVCSARICGLLLFLAALVTATLLVISDLRKQDAVSVVVRDSAVATTIVNHNLQQYMNDHTDLRDAIERDRIHINYIAKEASQKMSAISKRISSLQSQIVRMEAMGQRIANMAGLKQDEFNLDTPVGLGGPIDLENIAVSNYTSLQLSQDIAMLEDRLATNIDKLLALESLLMDKHLQDFTMPAGTPVPGGWISSSYGTRTDPFTGRREFHRGIDIAAKKNSRVLSVAPGMVVFSGYRPGYGNIVEIQHAEGFITKYGHNSKNVVKVGETVQKGQVIAIIGSSGRSTGLHVHFEVLKEGVPVNPGKFVLLR